MENNKVACKLNEPEILRKGVQTACQQLYKPDKLSREKEKRVPDSPF